MGTGGTDGAIEAADLALVGDDLRVSCTRSEWEARPGDQQQNIVLGLVIWAYSSRQQ